MNTEVIASSGPSTVQIVACVLFACAIAHTFLTSYFQHLAQQIQQYLRQQMPLWRDSYPGVETMTVAVMGCVVNGPGESKRANIGISLPGTGERPVAPVYVDGEKTVTLKGDHIAEEFQQLVDDYVVHHYGNPKSNADSNSVQGENLSAVADV